MKPDLSEIKPVAVRCFSVEKDINQYADYIAEYHMPAKIQKLYDQSALEAAHEAGRRAALEEALTILKNVMCHLVPESNQVVADTCVRIVSELLEQKS